MLPLSESIAASKKYDKLPSIPKANKEVEPYQPFYVLTDKSYGSNENALIRIEVPESYASYEVPLEADIRVYKINKPLEFLQKQPDLHRIQLKGSHRGPSIAPAMSYLWDSAIKSSRLSWQRIFSAQTRQEVIKKHPELKIQSKTLYTATKFEQRVQYNPLDEYPIITQIRYPLWQAKPISAPEDVKLSGSSSNFIQNKLGNTMLSVGKLSPGLYLVETMIADQRATALLFISDTVAISKSSTDQLFVWTVNRQNGQPNGQTNLLWTDGVGVLQKASTDNNGMATLKRATPEHSYLMGEDNSGGVFVSENYYYDSEVYNTKLYAFTDRPLYKAGEEVNIKAYARTFLTAQNSKIPENTPIQYQVVDPAGAVLYQDKLTGAPEQGVWSKFTLPENALPGGYELLLSRGEDLYTASFRVANYIKPHFDILLNTPNNLKTGKEIDAKIELRYPNGEPVKNAQVSVNVRSQRLSMVDGQLEYTGMFPIQLDEKEYKANDKGELTVKLPKADEPSRYVVSILASDAAAYRVKMTREVLIERGVNPYALKTEKQFGQEKEEITFSFQSQGQGGEAPVKYEVMRLEDQSKFNGSVSANQKNFSVKFKQAGSYTVMLKDKFDNLLGATNYWVQGKGMEAAPDSVEIVLDKPQYSIGETAQALVTFPVDVKDALLTMERDNVENYGLLSQNSDWFSSKKINNRQYLISLPVTQKHTPNMTFSVLYQKDGGYFFQNMGISVIQPQIDIAIKPNKTTYKPKEKVTIELDSSFDKQAISTNLAISVVDEMVYVLQPEIAPNIVDFFYHPRRNNVTTNASLNFIGYDKSVSALNNQNSNRQIHERAIKVLERPRREEKDTAYWNPSIQTDKEGKTTISFELPDSLTRWRITVRAVDKNGHVGQKTAYILSDQPYYIKWTGPKELRTEDTMNSELLAFNQTKDEIKAQWRAQAGEKTVKEGDVTLKPGANYINVPINGLSGDLNVTLQQNGQVLDRLASYIQLQPKSWTTAQQVKVDLTQEKTKLSLPADAQNIRLNILPKTQASFNQVLDDLIVYPYGCVEQISSRLIPLSMAYQLLPSDTPATIKTQLKNSMTNQRQRLADMAGPNAQFTWWGGPSDYQNLFVTSYAYYADWYTAQALNIPYNKSDAEQLLRMYQKQAGREPILHRTLSLWFMKQMGLPVPTLLSGIDQQLISALSKETKTTGYNDPYSLIFSDPDSTEALQMAALISEQLHKELNNPIPEKLLPLVEKSRVDLQKSRNIAIQSLLALNSQEPVDFDSILAKVSSDYPTIERSLSLIWLKQAGFKELSTNYKVTAPIDGWKKQTGLSSGTHEWLWLNQTPPSILAFSAPPEANQVAIIRFNSKANTKNALPIGVTRNLYRLEPSGKSTDKSEIGFKVVPVKEGETLQSNRLYVDEIVLTPKANFKPLHYALVEVALPPGANIESTTWGMNIAGLDTQDAKPFGNSTYEEGTLSYRLPVTQLNQSTKLRQLVRFSQKGNFYLPPARLFKMYQPEQSAMQQATQATLNFKVE